MGWFIVHLDVWHALLVAGQVLGYFGVVIGLLVIVLATFLTNNVRQVLAGAIATVICFWLVVAANAEQEKLSTFLTCRQNVANIAGAIRAYADSKGGGYPKDLNELIPDYLRAMPKCPSISFDTYSMSYQATPTSFTIFCKGDHHKIGWLQLHDEPRYDTEEGLVPSNGE
jgi:hypothetical protein